MTDIATILSNYKAQIESSIADYVSSGKSVPSHLLERLSWLKAGSSSSGSESGESSSPSVDEIKTLLQEDILTALQNISIEADSVNLNTDTLEALITAIRDKLPTTLGQKASSGSLSITFSSDASLPSGTNSLGSVSIDALPSVVVSSLPLATDAASETTLAGIKALFGLLADAASSTGGLLARLRLIIEGLYGRTNRVDRSGSTSITPSTWTTAINANSSRRMWRVHNPPTNSGSLEVGYLVGSTNVRTVVLLPGGSIEESLPSFDVSPQAIVVRSTVANLSYDAVEA